MTERISGTKEWAPISKNIQMGCDNGGRGGCLYCYARARALRFKQIPCREAWATPILNQHALKEKPRKLNGRIFFPSAHDITPDNIEVVEPYLRKWLAVGNEFLIVSKPHISCITRLTFNLAEFKDQIMFRFSIGSTDDKTLAFWEPGLPDYYERFRCLQHAFRVGYKTSVSCEPFLDGTIDGLVAAVEPWVSDDGTIWIGKMNKMETRVKFRGISYKDASKNPSLWTDAEWHYWNVVMGCQTDDAIKALFERQKANQKVRFKDSVKQVVGLELASEAGLDV